MSERTTYNFRFFRNRLICVDQGIWQAVRALLLSYGRNGVRSLGISIFDVLIGIAMMLRYRLSGASRPTVKLPAFGNLAFKVHKGHKVFDLEQSTVTKSFAGDVSEVEAMEQIRACQRASSVDAAPRFIAADPLGRWYSEEYVSGTHGTETKTALDGKFMKFYPDVEQCLLDLIGAEDPANILVVSYIEELTDATLFKAWDESSEIRRYQLQLKHWLLKNLVTTRLQLGLIHGDFSLVNVVVEDRKFRVIDWEGIRFGNIFGDCFNFVFAEKYYGRARSDITGEIRQVFSHFGNAALERYPNLKASIDVPLEFAVRLYYLERLKVMLERDVSSNLMSEMRKSMHMFREFDNAAGFPVLEEQSP